MTDLRTYQPAFTAGELSPALWARADLAKYSTGLQHALNLFIHPHGGASNRAGTEFIREGQRALVAGEYGAANLPLHVESVGLRRLDDPLDDLGSGRADIELGFFRETHRCHFRASL